MPRKSKAVTESELSQLVRTVSPEVLAAIPVLQGSHAKLRGMISELSELFTERAVHEARAQEVTTRIDEILESGSRTATFMRLGLRNHFGPASEHLVAFGIKPSRARKRLRKPAAPGAPQED